MRSVERRVPMTNVTLQIVVCDHDPRVPEKLAQLGIETVGGIDVLNERNDRLIGVIRGPHLCAGIEDPDEREFVWKAGPRRNARPRRLRTRRRRLNEDMLAIDRDVSRHFGSPLAGNEFQKRGR